MFSKTVALLSLAAIVSGRVMVAVEMTNVPTPTILPTPTASLPASGPPSTPTPGIPPSSGAMDGPCTEEGIWNCIDGSSFQRCASGVWSAVMPVAPGTHCARGIREDLKIMRGKFPGGSRRIGTPTIPSPGIHTPGPIKGTPSEPQTGRCEMEGVWNCIDGSSFQRCASGVWSVIMPVAPGTHCARGIREDLKIMHGKFPGGTPVSTPTAPTPGIPTPGPVDGTPSEARTGRCKMEGVWNCIDGASYQRCASGEWSVVQDVAPGTKCMIGMNDSYKMQLKRPFMHRKRRVMV